jgi:hypothetical protein
MSGTGDEPQWLVDGVSVGPGPSTPPAPAGPQDTPPQGTPIVGGAAAVQPDRAGVGTAPGGAMPPGGATVPPPGPGGGPAATTPLLLQPVEPSRRTPWLIVGLAVLVAIGIVLVVLFTVVLTGGPDYKLHLPQRAIPVGPSAVKVAFLAKNVGTASGTPVCTITVTGPRGVGTGTGTFTELPLDAGKTTLYFNTVHVTRTTASGMATRADVQVTCS